MAKKKRVFALITVVVVFLAGSGLFVSTMISRSADYRDSLLDAKIASTEQAILEDLNISQWKTAPRGTKLQTALNFLMETSWKDEDVDDIGMRRLMNNRSVLTTHADVYISNHPEISENDAIETVFEQVAVLSTLAPDGGIE